MEKAFVNTNQKVVSGSSKIEAEKQKMPLPEEIAGDKKKEEAFLNSIKIEDPILLSDTPNEILLGICADPSLKTTSKDTLIIIFDDGTPIATISKNKIIETCQANMQSDSLKGISYLIPLYAHAVILEYKFQNRIEAKGDISGLKFYFKK